MRATCSAPTSAKYSLRVSATSDCSSRTASSCAPSNSPRAMRAREPSTSRSERPSENDTPTCVSSPLRSESSADSDSVGFEMRLASTRSAHASPSRASARATSGLRASATATASSTRSGFASRARASTSAAFRRSASSASATPRSAASWRSRSLPRSGGRLAQDASRTAASGPSIRNDMILLLERREARGRVPGRRVQAKIGGRSNGAGNIASGFDAGGGVGASSRATPLSASAASGSANSTPVCAHAFATHGQPQSQAWPGCAWSCGVAGVAWPAWPVWGLAAAA